MNKIPFYHTRISGSFWGERLNVSKKITVDAVYDRFKETKRFEALKCNKEQQDREGWHSHIFWDSDVAKWIEGAAYLLEEKRDERLEAMIDDLVADMCANQKEDGYYNCYYNVYETDSRFTNRMNHELYCLGHLIEAAVAYYHATQKDSLLCLVKKYTDLIIDIFVNKDSAKFVTPGHEEIELALVKLYHATGDKKYLELSKFFIDQKGCNKKDGNHYAKWCTPYYFQDHLPVREQTTAEGHSVRAMYLYCAMADLAKEYGDEELLYACEKLFENVSEKRMYITGGVGSSRIGEAFTVDYDMPNETAYTETCAAIGLALFCRRMYEIKPFGIYADIAEKALYNGSISGVSISGDTFFYENPLTVDLRNHNKNPSTTDKERYPITQRVKVFGCSCCPPNILRFVNSVADFLYTCDENTLCIHQFMNSETSFDGKSVKQITNYPSDGKVTIKTSGYKTVAVRIPSWCSNFTASSRYTLKDGYAYFSDTAEIDIDFHIKPQFIVSNGIHENAGKAALQYGPIIYCIEGIDNEGDIFSLYADINTDFEVTYNDYFSLPVITCSGYELSPASSLYYAAENRHFSNRKLTFIPYYGMENRGETDMTVWIPLK